MLTSTSDSPNSREATYAIPVNPFTATSLGVPTPGTKPISSISGMVVDVVGAVVVLVAVMVVVVGGRVVVVVVDVVVVVVGGRVVVVVGGNVVVVVVDVVVVVVGGRVVVVVEDVVVVGGRVVVVVVDVVVVVVGGRVVVVVGGTGGVTVRLKFPAAPPKPSTTMKYVCPAVTVGVIREAVFAPFALGHASSLHPDATSVPLAHAPLRR